MLRKGIFRRVKDHSSGDAVTSQPSFDLNLVTVADKDVSVHNVDLIDTWCDWYRAGDASPLTIRGRRYHMLRLAVAFPNVLEVDEGDLIRFMESVAHIKPASRKALTNSIRMFYRWAHRTGRIDRDPTVGLRRIKVPAGVPKPISEVAFAEALSKADGETRLMLLLGGYAGCRLSEIAGIHSEHVTDNGLLIYGKGRKERLVPIHPRLATALVGLEGWAFPSPVREGQHVGHDYVASRLEKVIPYPWTAHSLRHRFGTMTYRACKDIRVVQQLMGHASIQTTAGYTLVDDDALAAAVNGVA